jgi:hypothetical protein
MNDLDEIDKEFILLIMKGHSSSYRIWNFIGKNPDLNLKIKPMAYNNVNKRVLAIFKKGYLEEIKLDDKSNIHGRKDYKLSQKGMDFILLHMLTHPKDAKVTAEYINKFPKDKPLFDQLLINRVMSIMSAADQYLYPYGRTLKPSPDLRKFSIKKIPEKVQKTKLEHSKLQIENHIT